MSMGKKLRTLLKEKKFITSMGIDTPVHAKIVEKAGFDYAYLGGYDVSLALLGLPDVGLITETEMVATARNVARAVDIPVVCDADTGYGNAINVIRTVQNFEAAGVAAIHIEDQVSPKRCGHVAGKMIISLEEAVGKLKAALESRKDHDRGGSPSPQGGRPRQAISPGKEAPGSLHPPWSVSLRRPRISETICAGNAQGLPRVSALLQLLTNWDTFHDYFRAPR